MNPIRIGCIVEGRGDDRAVPTVVRRIAGIESPEATIIAETIIRRDRGLLVKQGHLEADVEFVARKQSGHGGILVVLDADDDCPATLGPQLRGWAANARPDLPVGLVLANREFEAWFLASAESLRGQRYLPESIVSHPRPETVRDAKGWLTAQMPHPKSYSPSVDQHELARVFDLHQARTQSDSFDKCYREIVRLLRVLA